MFKIGNDNFVATIFLAIVMALTILVGGCGKIGNVKTVTENLPNGVVTIPKGSEVVSVAHYYGMYYITVKDNNIWRCFGYSGSDIAKEIFIIKYEE